MKIGFHFGERVLVLPATLTAHLDKASKKDIAILLALAAEPMAQLDLSAAMPLITARNGYTADEINAALAFWRGAGVISTQTDDAPISVSAVATEAATVAPRVIAEKGLPTYSTEELSDILARRGELAQLVDDAQQAFGKIFNMSEIAIIAGLVDYLGLTGEYVLLLLTHCRNMEKKSLRYVEKMAITLHDQGLHGARELERHLQNVEMMASATGRVRTIFGVTERALTAKEKAMIERWVCEMKYDGEMLTRAYEMTVDAIGKASMPYANKILENWFKQGLKTLDEAKAAEFEFKKTKKAENEKPAQSFDDDEFFEAALKKSYKNLGKKPD